MSCYWFMEVTTNDWWTPFIDYLQYGMLPDDPQERSSIRKRAAQYEYQNGTLYRRDGLLLRCLNGTEIDYVLRQAHSGECEGHPSGQRLLSKRVQRKGYIIGLPWSLTQFSFLDPVMNARCTVTLVICHTIGVEHGNDFLAIHVVGVLCSWPINPASSKGHAYILAATDYFSK